MIIDAKPTWRRLIGPAIFASLAPIAGAAVCLWWGLADNAGRVNAVVRNDGVLTALLFVSAIAVIVLTPVTALTACAMLRWQRACAPSLKTVCETAATAAWLVHFVALTLLLLHICIAGIFEGLTIMGALMLAATGYSLNIVLAILVTLPLACVSGLIFYLAYRPVPETVRVHGSGSNSRFGARCRHPPLRPASRRPYGFV